MKAIKNRLGLVLGAFLLLGLPLLLSQHPQEAKPRKILGIAKEDKSASYYKEQSALWRELIDKNPKNAEAWHYYYKAERAMLQLEQPKFWANNKKGFFNQLSHIINDAKNYIGNKFEYYFLKGINSEAEVALNFLQKAYSIDPDRSEVHGWLFTHYVPLFDESQCTDLAQRMLRNNIYSTANLKWNYNALQSVDENGVIISNGDMDGLPKWVLQYGAGIRTDVLVTNKWLLAGAKNYREIVYKKLILDPPSLGESDFEYISHYADYLAIDILKRTERPAYISSGTPLQFFRDNHIDDKMYLVGNALKYSHKSFNNTSIIEENYEKKYDLEYLFRNFQYHDDDEVVRTQMNLTYLPSLIQLKNHYKESDQNDKYMYYDKLINRIVVDSGRKEEILDWFHK